ncbi:5-(carboxyamino)imidazole ribonucleotide synthase [Enhydrobacter aerosaccus]|uniref:N5-carboxyaminoimidazole ribonucleotide synthase n=1 Tax=Enhydrobacter aerosaccus TaxID=225324 RepID=A0A1T4KCW9_9HYPH|nr:5-(carboxyamino)imidazole ribonucleotide synthase [Enhydrobacter aerosaccus]SJZ40226.1 5-(carboxyamino)imidazole ribonucleotide synthase [Enhydrobacter aerosaccus]
MAGQILPPGSTIGILGGGQLGRMTAMAAARLGYRTVVFAPEAHSIAADVSAGYVQGAYDDGDALGRFAAKVDVITYEFENVPESTVAMCARYKPVRPGTAPLFVAQHRLREKAFFRDSGLGTADYQPIRTEADVASATAFPGILKTCTEGYDGKGQARVSSREDLASAWNRLGRRECILEVLVDFDCEVSAIVARGLDGQARCFPIGLNDHRDGILRTTTVPSGLPAETLTIAERYGLQLAEKLDLVGLVALEMFVTSDGKVLANEMAPRPHNSGHWTLDACATSQFEQLVRAICGLPLGAVDILAPSRMVNLIGPEADDWARYVAEPTARLHLYGKGKARPGRKMGHVTYVTVPQE